MSIETAKYNGLSIKTAKYIRNYNGIDYDCVIVELSSGQKQSVPLSLGNTDYQDILTWVAEGNTIEPADE